MKRFVSGPYCNSRSSASPIKIIIISEMLLQVAMEMVHKLKINCEMTLGAWMRGVIKHICENPVVLGL
jgi:hypothetical protein